MSSLILHCGGKAATYEDVCAVETPKATATYSPVPYADLIDLVRSEITQVLGLTLHSEAYGLNREGRQLFGVLTARTHDDHGMAIGLRASHDKSTSLASAVGDSVFVCDNMAFSTAGSVVMRQHRGNAFDAFRVRFRRQMLEARALHDDMTLVFDKLRGLGLSQDAGYELIGRAMGHGILSPRQASVAITDWRTPRHDVQAFTDRTWFALYQCLNQGLKKGPGATVMDRHTDMHAFVLDAADVL